MEKPGQSQPSPEPSFSNYYSSEPTAGYRIGSGVPDNELHADVPAQPSLRYDRNGPEGHTELYRIGSNLPPNDNVAEGPTGYPMYDTSATSSGYNEGQRDSVASQRQLLPGVKYSGE